MKETSTAQRLDWLKEIADTIHDTARTWVRTLESGEDIRVRWQDDGTALVEVDRDEVMRVRVQVDVSAVDYLDAVNKPTGFVSSRTWATVPAGWFVRTPKGTWLEVLASIRDGDRQMVTLNVNGKPGEWPRDPDEKISVRRGTLADKVMDAAMDALGDASILEDKS